MQKSKPLILQVLGYIAHPVVCEYDRAPWYLTILNVIRLWSLSFVFAVFFALLSNLLLQDAGYSQEDFKLTELITDFSPFAIFFLVAIWAPVSEEVAFRLWLKFSPFKWALGIGFFLLFLVLLIEPPFFPEEMLLLDSSQGILNSLGFLSISFVLIFSVLKVKAISFFVESFFKKYFHVFFYTLALLFAFIHLTNYDVDFKEIWYFAPLLIFPQLFLSFIITFIRMKYGFFWAMFSHSLNNIIAITPILLLSSVLEKDFFELETNALFETFSYTEIFLILICGFFLLLVFFVCLVSILSLLLEFTRNRD